MQPKGHGNITTPIFASNLLALFYVLRKNYLEGRPAENPVNKTSQVEEKQESILKRPEKDYPASG